MTTQEITTLLDETGAPCVSIIVPTHRLSPERIQDKMIVKKAVESVKLLLQKNHFKYSIDLEKFIQTLDETIEKIDYNHSKEGLGIFISPRIAQVVKFPFTVVEKISVENSFYSRDLLYYLYKVIDYTILSIGQKHIRLYAAKGEDSEELVNEDFPMEYKETYEYSQGSRITSYGSTVTKQYERDKSELLEIRLTDFLKSADRSLDKYINSSSSLVIAGGKKEIADYLQITDHMDKIIGKVIGNYEFNNLSRLSFHCWEEVQHSFQLRNETLLSNLKELLGEEKLAVGVEEVWEAAIQGQGLELIIEKDLKSHAYISEDGFDLKFQKPMGVSKYARVNDVIEKILRTVLDKGGKITFVDNGVMENFYGIALKLRY